ncbi:HNH endonuclease [Fictibacillus nanhaiensis]|uniref:HNH endonuclease n=1 Tax=Fictibacillus nanhaiensis TaxID=742169 RepID=UPI00203C7F03|nr:HNH endonuclease signature motif containing protein [Fictibacillus nanhaiensis]MCM3730106.1 HNH endonuclease [Fictibacillus nanhaiensis]
MSFQHNLNPSHVLTHRELIETFQVSASGGMRPSKKNGTLVLISDHTNGLYDDRWVEDVFHYTGMGQKGDQNLNYSHNKTLNNSDSLGVTVYLFEVFKPNNYIYQGEVYLAGEPYQESQHDADEKLRLVWVFPLKLKEGQQEPLIDVDAINSRAITQEKKVRKLSDEEVAERANFAPDKPGSRNVVTKVYERNAYISELAKRRANGKCQLCEKPAPFNDKKGNPYLENHHIIWLANGGEDTIENTVALCPNCHRKMHSLNLKEDVEKLQVIAKKEYVATT